MIKDIPSSDDFIISGAGFLNLAWDAVIQLVLNLDYSYMEEWDTDGEATDEYWKAAQKPLATALALAQQGAEMLLKGRIVEISPYLIISSNSNEWPRHCDQRDISFSQFRTIDSQDLIRVHDTVTTSHLPESFKTKYEELRRLRNTIMHTVDKRIRTNAKDIFVAILEMYNCLVDPKGWIADRLDYLAGEPTSIAGAEGYFDRLFEEISKVIDILEPSLVKRYFDFDKKARKYICCDCSHSCESERPNLAQLRPNKPNSNTIYCVLCGKNREVKRKRCNNPNCKSNVIDKDEDVCLICFQSQ